MEASPSDDLAVFSNAADQRHYHTTNFFRVQQFPCYNRAMVTYHKLVRDRIPEILDAKGVPYEQHTATDAEYRKELFKKLVEEATEFADDPSEAELADVLEVIDALCSLPEFAKVNDVKIKKRTERGGFEKRLILKGEK